MIRLINYKRLESAAIPKRNSSTNRIQYIDIAKGIAILAVIVGHVSIRLSGLSKGASIITACCFTFHMPLFFFLSGYFLHCDTAIDLKKEVKRLVLPYACVAILIVLLQIAITKVLGDYPSGMSAERFALEWFKAALYGSASISGKELWPQQFRIGAIWFLLALFWARIFVKLSYKFSYPAAIVFGLVFLGAVSACYVWLPLSFQAGLTATMYVYLGTFVRKHNLLEGYIGNRLLLAVSIPIWMYAVLRFNGFGMGLADFGHSVADIVRNIIGSIAASYVVLHVSALIEKHSTHLKAAMAKIGRLSLLILAVHIIDDDVTRIDAINEIMLGSGIGAFWVVILESVFRCTYSVCIALMLERVRSIRSIFS